MNYDQAKEREIVGKTHLTPMTKETIPIKTYLSRPLDSLILCCAKTKDSVARVWYRTTR
jgi:hypothetical protein